MTAEQLINLLKEITKDGDLLKTIIKISVLNTILT